MVGVGTWPAFINHWSWAHHFSLSPYKQEEQFRFAWQRALNHFKFKHQAYFESILNEPISFPFSKYLSPLSFLYDNILIKWNNAKREEKKIKCVICGVFPKPFWNFFELFGLQWCLKNFFIQLREEWKIDLLQTSNTAYFSNCIRWARKASLGVIRQSRRQFSEGPQLNPSHSLGRECTQSHSEKKHPFHFYEKSKQTSGKLNIMSNLSNSD